MKLLNQFKQYHIIKALETLEGNEKINLENDLKSFDLENLMALYVNRKEEKINIEEITPIESSVLNEIENKEYYKVGLDSIKQNEVAVVLMAGGQGTRLGHNGPKGTFDIGLASKKSLFELHCDQLNKLKNLTGKYVMWYIMTSEDNHEETQNFFEDKSYFNYSKDHIKFFKQDRLPLVLENGQLAMENSKQLHLAANGNGGVFTSLKSNGLLKEMTDNNVKYVFLYGVDNALAKPADPAFVGFMKDKNFDVASKAVDKVNATEKVGVMCYKNSKPGIVEYSELTDALRHEVDDNGTLVYRHANILAHLFKLDFIKKCSELQLPYHIAHKKVSYYDGTTTIVPSVPNGYKFELFMFDVFEYADDMAVLTVNRNEEFAPVKNKEGFDSPETAKKLYNQLNNNEEVT